MSTDQSKIDPNGRYTIFDSFGEEVEKTNDFDYAKGRADTNSGWVEDAHGARIVYDSET
jgi:hypothetical protein